MMGKNIFSKFWNVARSISRGTVKDVGPISRIKPSDAFARDLDFSPPSATGERVTEQSVLGIAAVWAALQAVSTDISVLPLQWFQDREDGKGRDKLKRVHPLQTLTDYPNQNQTGQEWRAAMHLLKMLYGNSYSLIVRDGNRIPRELFIIHPRRVEMKTRGNVVYYVVQNPDGTLIDVPRENILHLKGMSPDGLAGYCMLNLARNPLGIAQSLDKTTGAFIRNGLMPSAVLQHPGKLTPEAEANLAKSFSSWTGASNFGQVALVEEGMTLKEWSLDFEKTQLIQMRQFSVDEVSRITRVPPHMISSLIRSTFSNIESQGQDYVNYTLLSHAVSMEEALHLRVTGRDVRDIYCKHNFNAFLRGDSASRGAFFKLMLECSVFCPNDIAEREDMNPVPNGDTYWISNNVKPVELAIKPPPPPPAPVAPAPEGKPEQPDEAKADIKRARTECKLMLVEQISRSLKAEWNRYGKMNLGAPCDPEKYRSIIERTVRGLAAIHGADAETILGAAVGRHAYASNTLNNISEEEWMERAMSEAEDILEDMQK